MHDFDDWLKRNGYLRFDAPSAMDGVVRPKAVHPGVAIMKVPMARRAVQALAAEPDPEHVLVLVLSLFAGARPNELTRLYISQTAAGKCLCIHGEGGTPADSDSRLLIHPVLDAWLRPFYSRQGALISRERPLIALARILKRHDIPWKQAWLRNSYASYRLEATGDLVGTNKESRVGLSALAKRFAKRVTQSQAAAYFALTPEACGIADWAERVGQAARPGVEGDSDVQ